MNDNDSDNSNESINNIKNMEYDSYIEKKYINNIFKGINYYKDDKNKFGVFCQLLTPCTHRNPFIFKEFFNNTVL